MTLCGYNPSSSEQTTATINRNETTMPQLNHKSHKSSSGILQLFSVLPYAEESATAYTQSNQWIGDIKISTSRPAFFPTVGVPDSNSFPFPITVTDVCFRCRPNTTPSYIFTGMLTPVPNSGGTAHRSLRLPTGLVWKESSDSCRSPQSRYYNATRSNSPPIWISQQQLKSTQKQNLSAFSPFPSSMFSQGRSQRSEISGSEETQSSSTPRRLRSQRQIYQVPRTADPTKSSTPVHSAASPLFTPSSALPLPQLLSVGNMESSSTTSRTSYDPISFTLSLLGMKGATVQEASRPGLMDENDPSEIPLYLKSNGVSDRQKFITGLHELNKVIYQVGFSNKPSKRQER